MPMYKLKNDYYPMARVDIQRLRKWRKLHAKRAECYNQIGFLTKCKKEGLVPKGLKVKDKVLSRKCLKMRNRLENTFIKEQINKLFFKMSAIKREIEDLHYKLLWNIHPEIWIKIRDDTLSFENNIFIKKKSMLDKKLWNLMESRDIKVLKTKHSQQSVENFINLSNYNLSEAEKEILNMGPMFILSTDKLDKMEVAVDTELMMYRNQLEDSVIPEIVNYTINNKRKNNPNLTIAQKNTISGLKSNKAICIIKADKGNKFVIMNKCDYDTKLKELINSEDYKLLKKDPAVEIDNKLRKTVANISEKNKKENKLFENIINHYGRDPAIFANPKIHKINAPLRPIISSYNTVLSKAANYITPILNEMYANLPGKNIEVKNIVEAKKILKEDLDNNEFLLFSLDIINMFGNIDTDNLFHTIAGLVKKDTNFSSYTTLPKKSFLDILKLVISNSYFKFEEKYYSQVKGLPMGSPTSPVLAKIYVHLLENKWREIKNFEKITVLVRYMDDYVGKWKGTTDELETLLEEINKVDEYIKLTLEVENNSQINFLDSTITNEGNSLNFRTYAKEYAANSFLPANAFHDSKVKSSVIKGETIRTLRISDSPDEDLGKLKNKLIANKYNLQKVETIMESTKKKECKRKLCPEKTGSSDSKEKKRPKLVTKYLGKTTNILRKKLKHFNVGVVSRKQKNLEGIFSTTFKYKTDNDKGIVYKIKCSCGDFYVGESAFGFKKRQYEHLRDIKTKTETNALYGHCKIPGHSINWQESTLLDRETNQTRRRIKEAILIKNLNPGINVAMGMKIKGHWDIK